MTNLPTDIAWATGLFEGEGCLTLQSHQHKDRPVRKYPVASLQMVDEDIVRRFHSIVKVGKIYLAPKKSPRQDTWQWRIQNRADFKEFTDIVRPFLGIRRLARLHEIEAQQTLPRKRGC